MSAPADSKESHDESKGTPRSKLACTTCRAIKVRCIRPPGSSAICARCSRYGLQCADPPVIKRKGRPPNSSRGITSNSDVPAQVRFAQGNATSSISPKSETFGMGFNASISPSVPLAALGAQSLVDLSNSQPATSTGTHSLSPNSVRRRHNHNLNMAEYLDPADRDSQTLDPWFSNGPSLRAARYSPEEDADVCVKEGDDPVSLHVLSEVEANSLVQLFHERMNPLVAVLDQSLHTMPYLRRTSSVLFSTVLASASRFFRHDLHSVLISHARTVLDRALQAGSTDIGVIQSLMIQTYWKEPEDTSGWMKVGMALRLGYSLFWHIPRTGPLPDDELEARKLLNAERTWLCLFSFDRGQSYVHGLPTTMRLNHFQDPEVWARGHLFLGPSVDMHIAASIQLCQLKDYWGAVCEMKCRPDPTYLELSIETLTTQCDSMISKWFSKEAPPPRFDQSVEHVLLWSILDFIFVMKRYRLEMSPHDPIRVDACLEVVSRIADEIDIVAQNGVLIIMQDSASCMTANLVDFARKVFRFCSRSQKSFVLTILHRVLLAHASVTNEDTKTAPAYVARFIRRVLSALSVESRAGSPGLDPTMMSGESNGSQVDFFAELGLEEFMHVPEYVAQNEVDDGRYWANMLFSEMMPGGM